MMGQLLFFILLFTALPATARIDNFSEAKRVLPLIHASNPVTLYCGCRYSGKYIDLKSCGYVPHKDSNRAQRLEWEHVVPAHAFGQSFVEWREGSPECMSRKKKKMIKGRKCAQKNKQFAQMEGDLYNLYPEVGELNGLRSNFSMAAFSKSEKAQGISFGACSAVVHDRKFEPMDRAKGIVARVYMYMEKTYPGRGIISTKNAKLFGAWNKMYPVTAGECERAKKIKLITSRSNPILESVCAK